MGEGWGEEMNQELTRRPQKALTAQGVSNAFAAVEVAPSNALDRIAVADLKARVPRGLWIRVALRPPALPGRGQQAPG